MFAGSPKTSKNQWGDFIQAVEQNEVYNLKQLIAKDPKGEAVEKVRGPEGRTLLHVAAFEGAGDALLVLLRCPRLLRKLNSTDRGRRTPLHLSAAIGDVFCVRSLTSAGALIDPQDEWGQTPLHLAIKFDQLETCKLLLELGADAYRADLKGDNATDMAQVAQDRAITALLLAQTNPKKPSAWKCLLLGWGKNKRRSYEGGGASDGAGLAPPSPTGRLPVAQRLAGNTDHQGVGSPSRAILPRDDDSPRGKGEGKGYEDPDALYLPPPPTRPGDKRYGGAQGGPLSAAIAEAARAHATATPDATATAQGSASSTVPELHDAEADRAARTTRPAELSESDPRIEWHGLEPVYAGGEASNASTGGLSGWLRDKLIGTGSPDGAATEVAAPAGTADAERVGADTEDEDDDTSQEDESGQSNEDEQAGVNTGGLAGPYHFQFLFHENVTRLGFEVAWHRKGEDEVEPSVGAVQEGGQAAHCRMEVGDEIVMCNDASTAGKVRTDVIPLLKQRPLLLKVDRMVRLANPSISCVTIIASIGEDAQNLGIKLARAGKFPALAAIRPGSAAEGAGLLAGDALVGIGTDSMLNTPEEEVKAALQQRPLLLTIWRLPRGMVQWPDGFEAWDAQGDSHTIVDLRTR